MKCRSWLSRRAPQVEIQLSLEGLCSSWVAGGNALTGSDAAGFLNVTAVLLMSVADVTGKTCIIEVYSPCYVHDELRDVILRSAPPRSSPRSDLSTTRRDSGANSD